MNETFEWRNRPRLVEEVARVIRSRIYNGQYPPGKPLRQLEIAADLKISRTPLREALRLLERDGLVIAEGPRGVSVVNADAKQLLDAYLLRQSLDGLAARLAAERAATHAWDVLAPALTRQQQALSPWQVGAYTEANTAFHVSLYQLADNEYLSRQAPLVYMTSQIFSPEAKRERAYDAVLEHTAVAEAIRAGDGAQAEALARHHVQRTINWLLGHPR